MIALSFEPMPELRYNTSVDKNIKNSENEAKSIEVVKMVLNYQNGIYSIKSNLQLLPDRLHNLLNFVC